MPPALCMHLTIKTICGHGESSPLAEECQLSNSLLSARDQVARMLRTGGSCPMLTGIPTHLANSRRPNIGTPSG